MRSAIVTLLLISPAAWPQTPERMPPFETASIKMTQAKGGGGHSHESNTPGMLRGAMTLKRYIVSAYNVEPFQVTGGPAWIDESTYEIVAKLEGSAEAPPNPAPGGHPNNSERIHAALQTLLAERFQLKIHHESKDVPAYAMTVAKSGFKPQPDLTPGCSGGTNSNGNGVSQKFTATCIEMAEFASFLARRANRPVADQTHTQGRYSFTLEWTPDDLKNSASADQPALPSLFTVLQEQLGLKLEVTKAPVDIIVVDSAERPSEN
jgi:uncharacterized protein (TIGR03435 family)